MVDFSRWCEANGSEDADSIADVQIGRARKLLEAKQASLVELREQAQGI